MKVQSAFSKTIFTLSILLVCAGKGNSCFGQILTYTDDTGGVLSMVALHAKGDTLIRVNGASKLSTPCTHGFSSRSFTNASAYSDTLEAVEVSVAPDSGYILRVDSFKADLRHSPTGPANARFAYSTDSLTWITQGTDQFPYSSGTCDSMVTCKWAKTITVNYPKRLFFRIYGFNTSVTTGTGNLQIMNLIINGKAQTPASTLVSNLINSEIDFDVYPNPFRQSATIAYHLMNDEIVTITICNAVGQLVMPIAVNERRVKGDHSCSFPVVAPGVYFVKLTVGGMTFNRRVVRM